MTRICSKRRAARRLLDRLVLPSMVCGLAVTLMAGCGGEAGLLGALMGHIPTEEEIAEYSEQIEALPSADVRIVNRTDMLASVHIESGIQGLEDELFGVIGAGEFLTSVDSSLVLIAAQGTATGAVKCGDVIGIAIRCPYDGASFGIESDSYGLHLQAGNVLLTGIGAANETFAGDVVSTVRFLVPAEDGVDCTTATVVIEIDLPATGQVVDEETGAVVQPGEPGSGTLRLE
jgi:hypothetical protein